MSEFMRLTVPDMQHLVAIVAAIDGRSWADDEGCRATARSWHECIRRELDRNRRFALDYPLAEAAVYAWYGNRPPGKTRIMPDDILGQAAEIRARLLRETSIPDPPEDLDVFNPEAYDAAIDAARSAIVAGGTHADAEAAMAGVARQYPRPPRQLGRRR